MSEFEEDRAVQKDVDRYSFQWIPDRWEGDTPTGNRKTKHPDRRTAEEKAASHKRYALTEEERAENKKRDLRFLQNRKNNPEEIW